MKPCINVKNDDDMCFAAAIAAALLRRKKHPERYDDKLKRFMKTLNWEGIDFPADPWKASKKFEQNNPGFIINVYGYDEDEENENENDRLSIERISDNMYDTKNEIVDLLLCSNGETNHYV